MVPQRQITISLDPSQSQGVPHGPLGPQAEVNFLSGVRAPRDGTGPRGTDQGLRDRSGPCGTYQGPAGCIRARVDIFAGNKYVLPLAGFKYENDH